MRNIVEIGIGAWTQIELQEGDRFIATDPEFGGRLKLEPPDIPKGVDYSIDTYAIGNGTEQTFVQQLEHEGKPVTNDYNYLKSEAFIKERADTMIYEERHLKTITLDSWLEKYANKGFLEKIDFLLCTTDYGGGFIWENFSFQVKPAIILIKSYEALDLTPFTKNGYTLMMTKHPILMIHNAILSS